MASVLLSPSMYWSKETALCWAGEPKRLLEIEGGHYSVYTGPGADEAGRAAMEWFAEHLLNMKNLSAKMR